MVKRRQYPREFKISILQELESKSLAEVCRTHSLACSTVSGWKKEYEGNPKSAFQGNGNVWKESAKIAQYERLIGQLYAEIAFLKKAYESSKQLQVEERKRRFTKW